MDRQAPLDLATADGHDRHVPSGAKDFLTAGHVGVYEWAVENLVQKGARFLDLGCGTGYGSALVAAAGASYDGADGSQAAIDYAEANYARPNTRFLLADLMEPPPAAFPPRSYDVVFSSEVLEHVDDPFAFVGVMASFLRDDGTCFVGTPNRLWSRDHMPGGRLMARSHVMEFTPPALEALLRTAFEEVRLFVRMFPEEAIRSAVLPSDHSPLAQAALALARRLAPVGLERYRRGFHRRRPQRVWSSQDIAWLEADDPRLEPDRSVGLAAVCRNPKR